MPIPATPATSIKPSDIQFNGVLNAFRSERASAQATVIIQFCQCRKKGWGPVPLDELRKFSYSHGFDKRTFRVGDLLAQEPGPLIHVSDGYCILTKLFVEFCYGFSRGQH